MPTVNPVTHRKFCRVFPFEDSRLEKLIVVGTDCKILLNQIVHRYERRTAALKSLVCRRPPFFVNLLNRKPALPKFIFSEAQPPKCGFRNACFSPTVSDRCLGAKCPGTISAR